MPGALVVGGVDLLYLSAAGLDLAAPEPSRPSGIHFREGGISMRCSAEDAALRTDADNPSKRRQSAFEF